MKHRHLFSGKTTLADEIGRHVHLPLRNWFLRKIMLAALTSVMIGLQRRLILILAQVLVQVGVHTFVVILRVIHCEAMKLPLNWMLMKRIAWGFSVRNFNEKSPYLFSDAVELWRWWRLFFLLGNLSFTTKPSHGGIQFHFHHQLGALFLSETFAFHETIRSANVTIIE